MKALTMPPANADHPSGRGPAGALAPWVAVPAAAAAAVWLAVRFAPGTLLPFVVPAAAAVVSVAGVALLRRLWGGPTEAGDLTALRRAGEIVYHAEEGIVTVNARGLVVDLNPAAQRLFGYHTADVINQPISMLLAEQPCQERQSLLRESLPTGSILGLAAGAREVVGIRKNGERFPLELTGNNLLEGDESLSVAFVRDVSKRKRAQRYLLAHYTATCVLAEAESVAEAMPRILRALGEALQWDAAGYWVIDPKAEVARLEQEYRSPNAAAPPGAALPPTCSRDQGLPGRVWAAAKPVWCEDVDRVMPASGEPGGPLRGAFGIPVVVGDDVCGVLVVSSRKPEKRDDQLLGVMTELGKQLSQFVTRKRQEEALRETTQTLRSLVHWAPVSIYLVDPTANVRLWNPAAERVFGWTEAEVLGKPLPPLANDPAAGPATDSNGDIRLSTRCRRKDGKPVEVSLSTAQLKDAAGHIVGTLGIGMDLTERRSLEHQLRQAQKMEAIGRLAGGIAHDFNNLMTIINGYCDLLLAGPDLDEAARSCLAEIHKAGERATGLTRQLLAFSRKDLTQPRLLDLNDSVMNVQTMLRRLIGADIQLSTSLAPDLGCVCADPGQIEQVLVNLAVNARDAMPQGGSLFIETAPVEVGGARPIPELVPGRYVRLEVRDTGCGMDATTLGRIFEPFFTTKDVGKGTGLGLATVYGIVQQGGGHVRVTSTVGKGSAFEVYLPVAADASEIAASVHDDGPAASAPAGRETVLLAEDEDGLRSLARRVLREKGYTVLEANNGDEALRVAERSGGAIDLLLTDVVMPHNGGGPLAQAMAQRFPLVKVLYMSGYTGDEVLRNGVLRSANTFLPKPFSPDQLLHKVREVLDTRH
jgi:two-component system, cell cycle sensor histidine kinase and response regulator CckA